MVSVEPRFHVKLTRGQGFSDREWEKMVRACQAWEDCWNTPFFWDTVLRYSYSYKTRDGRTYKGNGFTYTEDRPEQIMMKALQGAETLLPALDWEADVEVHCGNQEGVKGWTLANTLKQWVSRWFLTQGAIADLSGNRAHEYLHKLGYHHPFKPTLARPHSAPYAIGYLTRDWIKANFKG